MSETVNIIRRLVTAVQANEDRFGVFSTGEKLAIALVLDRKDLLAEVHGGYSMLEAVNRLGPEWTEAALTVQRSMS
jgi:hypothetical protein